MQGFAMSSGRSSPRAEPGPPPLPGRPRTGRGNASGTARCHYAHNPGNLSIAPWLAATNRLIAVRDRSRVVWLLRQARARVVPKRDCCAVGSAITRQTGCGTPKVGRIQGAVPYSAGAAPGQSLPGRARDHALQYDDAYAGRRQTIGFMVNPRHESGSLIRPHPGQ